MSRRSWNRPLRRELRSKAIEEIPLADEEAIRRELREKLSKAEPIPPLRRRRLRQSLPTPTPRTEELEEELEAASPGPEDREGLKGEERMPEERPGFVKRLFNAFWPGSSEEE